MRTFEKTRARPRIPGLSKRRVRRPLRRVHVEEYRDALFSLAAGILAAVGEHWTRELPKAIAAAIRAKAAALVLAPLPDELRVGLFRLAMPALMLRATGDETAFREIEAELGMFGAVGEHLADEPLATIRAHVDVELRRRAGGHELAMESAAVLGVTPVEILVGAEYVEMLLAHGEPRGRGRPRLRDATDYLSGMWLHAQRRSRNFSAGLAMRTYALATGAATSRAERVWWKRRIAEFDTARVDEVLEKPEMAPIQVWIPRRR